MIRFRCPACAKTLKVPESLAGNKVTCPRCHEPSVAPDAPPEPQVQVRGLEEAPGLFSGMSPRLRGAVALVATAGGLGLLTAALVWLLGGEPWVGHGAAAVAGCALVGLLLILHGHGTGCPRCGKWWSRARVGSEIADREVFERGGARFGRSTTRTDFKCAECGHGWSVVDAEEYQVPERSGAQRVRE